MVFNADTGGPENESPSDPVQSWKEGLHPLRRRSLPAPPPRPQPSSRLPNSSMLFSLHSFLMAALGWFFSLATTKIWLPAGSEVQRVGGHKALVLHQIV